MEELKQMVIPMLTLMVLAFIQNVSFSLTSRSRNRDNLKYHIFAASGSNIVWFLTFKQILTYDMNWLLLLPYTIGTVSGSVYGVKVAMWIERKIGATSDGHLKNPLNLPKVKEPKNLELEFMNHPKYGRLSLIKSSEPSGCTGCIFNSGLGCNMLDDHVKICLHRHGIWIKRG